MKMGLSRRSRENYRDYFVLDESKMDSGSLQNYSLLDTVQDGETTYGIYARQNQLNHPFKNLTKRRGISTIQLDTPRCFVTDLSFFTFFVWVFAKLGGFLFEKRWSHKNSRIKLGGIRLNAASFCAILLDKRICSKKGGFCLPFSIA